MTMRAYSRYTPQQVVEFARSYRKAEFLAHKDEILGKSPELRPEERALFLAALEDAFDGSPLEVGVGGAYELVLFLWPSGEAAFLAVASESFSPGDRYSFPLGRAHWRISSPCTEPALGLPASVVIELYRLRAGAPVGDALVWDGWQLRTSQQDEAEALVLREGRGRDAAH